MFKVGDFVWAHRHGWGRVYRIDEGYKFCVNVDFKDLVGDFTADGKYSDDDLMGSLFFEELKIPQSAIVRPKWKAEDGGIFYYVTEYGDIHDGRQDESNFAERMWEVGNYFKTWKLAQESKFFKMYQGNNLDSGGAMNKKEPIIFAIMGKSGSGKSTVIQGLTEKSSKYHQVKSYTTRAERLTDPNDKKTHVFVDEDFWEENKDRALATYHSPKGYVSWVDADCFLEDKINLYAIDSVAFNSLPKDVFGIYLHISDESRKERYYSREQTLSGFSVESHLNESHIKRKHTTLDVSDSTVDCVIAEVAEIIEQTYLNV